jgi:hypothetical protein
MKAWSIEDHLPNEKAVRTCAFVGRLLGQPVNFVAELINENDEEAMRSAYLRATSSLKGTPNDLADRVGFEQEPVVPELRLYDVHFIVTRQQTRDFKLLFQRVEAVARDAGDCDACANSAERFGDATSSTTDVVMIHGIAQYDVAVRVESSNELLALILEV